MYNKANAWLPAKMKERIDPVGVLYEREKEAAWKQHVLINMLFRGKHPTEYDKFHFGMYYDNIHKDESKWWRE